MNHRHASVAVAVALPALLAGCSKPAAEPPRAVGPPAASATTSPSATPSATPTPTRLATGIRPCKRAALRLGHGPLLAAITGEHHQSFTLINRATTPCTLRGFPAVTLYNSRGTELPFHYMRGQGMYITSAAPSTVTIKPRSKAYFLVAKYRCDTGTVDNATTIRIRLPTSPPIELKRRLPRDSSLHYCKDGASYPGRTVEISPIGPTALSTTRYGD